MRRSPCEIKLEPRWRLGRLPERPKHQSRLASAAGLTPPSRLPASRLSRLLRVTAHGVLGLMAFGFLLQMALITADPATATATAGPIPHAAFQPTSEVPPLAKLKATAALVQPSLALLVPPRIDIQPPAPPEPAIVDHGQIRREKLRQKISYQPNVRSDCSPEILIGVIYDLAEKFGEVRIASTHRDPKRNARVGGARRSFHLDCRAIDFMVPGKPKQVLEFLKNHASVGGYKRYPLGHYHIDDGPRRTW